MKFIQNIDNGILYFIEDNLHGGILDYIFKFVNLLMEGGALWIIAGIVMLFNKSWRKAGIMLLLTLGLTALIGNFVLKGLIFTRTRPFNADPSINVLIRIPFGEFSFPSNHALTCASCAVIVCLRNKLAGVFAWVFTALVGFSRIFFAVHYFSDVIGGIAFGIAIGLILYVLYINVPRLFNDKNKNDTATNDNTNEECPKQQVQ